MNALTLPEQSELTSLAALINGTGGDLSNTAINKNVQSIDLQNTDPQNFLQKLDYHGIALLAQQNMTQRQQALPKQITDLLTQRKAMMVANEVLKRRALTELFEAFSQAGLQRIVLFKGAALAYSVYASPWLRPRSDSDCIIDKAELSRFGSVFAELGYQKLFAIEGKHIHYQSTFSKPLAGQTAINIDLHWHINNRKILAKAFNVDQLRQDGQALSGLSDAITAPCAVDSLLIASLHRLGHHIREERLIWLYDIHLLAGVLTEQDWQQLCQKAEDKQLSAITLDALSNCVNLLKTEVPEKVIRALQQAAQQTELSQLFLDRDLPEWKYFWLDLQALPGLWPKTQAIWQNLIPSPTYIRNRMGTRSALVGYCKRLLRGFKRIVS